MCLRVLFRAVHSRGGVGHSELNVQGNKCPKTLLAAVPCTTLTSGKERCFAPWSGKKTETERLGVQLCVPCPNCFHVVCRFAAHTKVRTCALGKQGASGKASWCAMRLPSPLAYVVCIQFLSNLLLRALVAASYSLNVSGAATVVEL